MTEETKNEVLVVLEVLTETNEVRLKSATNVTAPSFLVKRDTLTSEALEAIDEVYGEESVKDLRIVLELDEEDSYTLQAVEELTVSSPHAGQSPMCSKPLV